MLSAEAMRLAAFEVLCPTAARISADGSGFPTLAGHRVFDSRAAAVAEIDGSDPRGYTPVLSLYTPSSRMVRRADAADERDNECEAVLEIVAELAVVARDDEGDFVDALAGSDPEARLVLAGLASQVRSLLEFSPAGILFRNFVIGVRRIEREMFAVPNLGLRWHRETIRITAAVPDDAFLDAGGLPEPVRSLSEALPEGSYARSKLSQLAAHFTAVSRPPLQGIAVFDRVAADPETDDPIASTGDLT